MDKIQTASDILRKKIKQVAEDKNVHDNKNPSRLYCQFTIEAIASLTGMPVDKLVEKINKNAVQKEMGVTQLKLPL